MNNSIFSFSDYKAFIRGQSERGMLKRIADHLNVNSTMISQIMSGNKDFTLEQAERLLSFFNLRDLEGEYFVLLIQIERAGTESLKSFYRKRLNDLRSQSLSLKNRLVIDRELSAEEKATFYSSWAYSAVQIFTSISDGQSFDSIQKEFNFERHRLEIILEFLVSTGLCKLESGLYRPGVQSTHVEKGSPFLVQHHTNWRVKAIEKVEKLEESELMFTANLTLAKKDFPILREQLVLNIKEFINKVKDSPSETMANLNIDFFFIK